MNNRNEIAELLKAAKCPEVGCCIGVHAWDNNQRCQWCTKRDKALAALRAEPVGKLVDSGFRQIEWYNKPPVDSLLYTSPQPAKEAEPDRAISEAYDSGFRRCAEWARRDDLLCDVGSPAYLKDKAFDLRFDAGVEVPPQPAKVPEALPDNGDDCHICGVKRGDFCEHNCFVDQYVDGWNACREAMLTAAPAEPAKVPEFPVALRKMWSGREVQEWLNEHFTTAPAAEERPEIDTDYPRDIFSELILKNSPYAFYIFQWVPYQTDAKQWRLKMCHDVKTFDGREAHGIWPNGSSCGPFKDDEVEFIRISKEQHGWTWQDPRGAPHQPAQSDSDHE